MEKEKLPGITREEEEEKLRKTIAVADAKLENTKRDVQALADELHEMLEVFDEKDKEALALWHNTDARFTQVNQNLRCAQQARKKPYFGRIDFRDKKLGKDEVYYIGRSVIAEDPARPEVIDWRAPIAGVYYDAALGDVTYSVKGEGRYDITLSRKRTYEIEDDRLKDFYDSDVVANDELLTKYLAKNKRAVLGEIIATIQREQNEVIRKKPQHNLIIQGAAGSGKTTVAMHRISYILYNYELEFAPQDFYIVGSNQVLLQYITGVLPELNVYGVSQMTMEQLFVRLLYEDWERTYTVKPVERGITPPQKGTGRWFHELEDFCWRYERKLIPLDDVRLEKNGVVLLTKQEIWRILVRSRNLSRADKLERLTDHVMAKLENEISGKYYSYTAEEKKRLRRQYETYFGKRMWKGSIFALYEEFLQEQKEKGLNVPFPGTAFDVYDLAALAYLYKRIKETEVIREAGHVVIDEAQDFGMMIYGALKYCLSKCTYTIMGDVAQNISLDYGLNDWAELRELMLPGKFDTFGLLRKSYRNTVEIAHFATDILYHGSFQVYPVEPIIRHGKEVQTEACVDFPALLKRTGEIVRGWQEDGLETIAVICADAEQAGRVKEGLSGTLPLLSADADGAEFGAGVMVLSLEYTKGLEFDAVLIFDASDKNYPYEDGYVKRLYVAATRALHELTVLYQGSLTGLIAEPVPEGAKERAAKEVSAPAPVPVKKEPEKLNTERYRERAVEGEAEIREREKYGPRRIGAGEASYTGKAKGAQSAAPRQAGTTKAGTALQGAGTTKAGTALQGAGTTKTGTALQGAGTTKTGTALQGAGTTKAGTAPEREGAGRACSGAQSAGEFGELPDNQILRTPGHARIDCAVRFLMQGKGYYDVQSSYGTLRVTPVSGEIVRICFARGSGVSFPAPLAEFAGKSARCRVRENANVVEILTERVLVRIGKRTGAVCFLTPGGRLLLSEREKEPRQIFPGQSRVFFDWPKEERLTARGIPGSEQPFLEMGNLARYISFGENVSQTPGLASSYGYELLFPAAGKTLCCRIPMYGSYVAVEGSAAVDYYFIFGGKARLS